jgi:uncharacterized protein (TIGR02453 family)
MSRRTKSAHFTPELFRFLRELARNNDRTWFADNRERYHEHVRDPMLRFIEDVGPPLGRISRAFLADPSLQGGSMFRIHRDVRFSKDKSPYKTAASAQFRHRKGRDVHAPGFYVHLEPGSVFAGAGIWRPDGPSLARIRGAIVGDPARWKRLVGTKAFKDGTLRLAGDALKRAPRGYDSEHPLIDDLRRKDFVTVTDLDEKTACAPDFLERYIDSCRKAGPFVRYLNESLDLAW